MFSKDSNFEKKACDLSLKQLYLFGFNAFILVCIDFV